jgi:hypothetical protein
VNKPGILEKAEEYIYRSARDYYYGKQFVLLKIGFLVNEKIM